MDSQKALIKKFKWQNERLRGELSELVQQLESILKRSQQANSPAQKGNKQVSQCYAKIQQYKRDIKRLRIQLEAGSDQTELINQNKFLKLQLHNILQEQETLQRVVQEQKKVLDAWENSQSFNKKSKELQMQIKEYKKKYRNANLQIVNEENQYNQNHSKMMLLREKIRKFRQRRSPEIVNKKEIQLNGLKRSLQILEKSKSTQAIISNRRIAELDNQISETNKEITDAGNKIKEKQSELQLKSIKIKELKNTLIHLKKQRGQVSETPDIFQAQSHEEKKKSIFSKPKLKF